MRQNVQESIAHFIGIRKCINRHRPQYFEHINHTAYNSNSNTIARCSVYKIFNGKTTRKQVFWFIVFLLESFEWNVGMALCINIDTETCACERASVYEYFVF